MRSKLFVPGSRPELFAKALAGDADALSFDLEDAVQESRKAEARQTLQTFLQEIATRPHGKIVIVRVNGLATPHFEADVAVVAAPGVDMINLPKPESAAEVRAAAAVVARTRPRAASRVRSAFSPTSSRPAASGSRPRSRAPIRAWWGSSSGWATSSSPTGSTGPTRGRCTRCSWRSGSPRPKRASGPAIRSTAR
jgi:citrate lyase subunit beta/citryl-CoA lyase